MFTAQTFFFPLTTKSGESKCHWEMGRTDGVYRQMRKSHAGQMRAKNIEIRHFGEFNLKKKNSRCVSDKWDGTSQVLLGPHQGSVGLSLLAMNVKAMDLDVKGCQICSKIYTCRVSPSHTSLCQKLEKLASSSVTYFCVDARPGGKSEFGCRNSILPLELKTPAGRLEESKQHLPA